MLGLTYGLRSATTSTIGGSPKGQPLGLLGSLMRCPEKTSLDTRNQVLKTVLQLWRAVLKAENGEMRWDTDPLEGVHGDNITVRTFFVSCDLYAYHLVKVEKRVANRTRTKLCYYVK